MVENNPLLFPCLSWVSLPSNVLQRQFKEVAKPGNVKTMLLLLLLLLLLSLPTEASQAHPQTSK